MGGAIMSSIGFNSNGNFRVNGIERSFGNFSPYHLIEGGISLATSIVTTGFSTTLYTGNATTQSITTDVDMSTQWGNNVSETFGGLVWIKGRSGATNNYLVDTVRGATHDIYSNATTADTTEATGLTAFGSTGFNIGALAGMNTNLATYASWNFQTTHRRTGVTNHGKAFTEHYNPFTGFTIVKYEGSGLAGHEIPHLLGRKLDFVAVKNLSATADWVVNTSVSMGLTLNSTIAHSSGNNIYDATTNQWSDNSNVKIGFSVASLNASSNQYIMYGWANSYFDEKNTLIGNYEIGVYQGTGASGNKVSTRGKPAWVMVKRLDTTGNWVIQDNMRVSFDANLLANSSAVEAANDLIDSISDGFTHKGSNADTNASGGQYLYMVVYDNDSGSGKSKYPKATDNPTLNLNAKVPFANGVDVNGVKNSIIVCNETVTGITLTQGKNYVYKKNDGTYGVNNVAPSYGNPNPANGGDFYNVTNNTWYTSAGVVITESRNYLDAIVWADQNGQVEYVEQLPKTVYFDEVKANEFKGKNACTAWVNFDGTTTPPTIRDSFNVSAVVRTATGAYDVYFTIPMDNANYSVVATGDGAGANDNDLKIQPGTTRTTTKISLSHVGSTLSNTTNANAVFFGGKN